MSASPESRDALREKQVREAEELLFTGAQKLGVAKGFYLGRFVADWVMPYPILSPKVAGELEAALKELRAFLDKELDPRAIDRDTDIPRGLIEGLGRLGVLGMTAPVEVGGRGFPQMAYARVMEEIGARCGSTGVFVNAHHSIGVRALLLFGTPEQRQRWLPPLMNGQQLAAFALTEPEAGSDAANVQTQAVPSADGAHYVLNGQKRYITNGSIAQVLTVMARTPVPGKKETAITAFLVTPDMPGFQVTQARMEKMGIRGTVTSCLEFHNMVVPRENILGPLGKGLKLALTVLDFGRTTFGACCTGAAKTCLRLSVEHVNTRRQFGRTLGEFDLVKKRIARMAAFTYAMEAMTTVTASLIDRGLEDYMLETAILKVFTTEMLWVVINDTFQVHGGAAFFTDRPVERMLRDARINQIAEGANEVLTSFIALVGMRAPGTRLMELRNALNHPWGVLRKAWLLGMDHVEAAVSAPDVPVQSPSLQPLASRLGRLIWRFNNTITRALLKHREEILERQLVHERLARAAMELYACACVLSRWDAELKVPAGGARQQAGHAAASLFMEQSFRRIHRALADMRENDDAPVVSVADQVLAAGGVLGG